MTICFAAFTLDIVLAWFFVTSASRNVMSASRYQKGSSMFIRGLIPRNSTEFAGVVPIGSA